MSHALYIQKPQAEANKLILLFHGVGSNAADLQFLGQAIAKVNKRAFIISTNAFFPSDLGEGFQWFSVSGICEKNRQARVDAAMPHFLEAIRYWQDISSIGPAQTTLIGFSQGAIMSLESTKLAVISAKTVIALSGRFATLPEKKNEEVVIHLLHGDQDPIMPVKNSIEARRYLTQLGTAVTLDIFTDLQHHIDFRVANKVIEYCSNQT